MAGHAATFGPLAFAVLFDIFGHLLIFLLILAAVECSWRRPLDSFGDRVGAPDDRGRYLPLPSHNLESVAIEVLGQGSLRWLPCHSL